MGVFSPVHMWPLSISYVSTLQKCNSNIISVPHVVLSLLSPKTHCNVEPNFLWWFLNQFNMQHVHSAPCVYYQKQNQLSVHCAVPAKKPGKVCGGVTLGMSLAH